MFRNQSVSTHQFAMVPRAEIPRSSFVVETAHKKTFDAGGLYPFYVDEMLPGDSFVLNATIFARMATPVFPIMDNLTLETFFFFVPNRLVWDNWAKFNGEQKNPGDSTSYLIPQVESPAGGFTEFSLYDHFGIPCAPQTESGAVVSINALPFRAYNLILNEWFRDENLENSYPVETGDGPDLSGNYQVRRRGKRHDYFTSCLPWLQKGPSVPLPLGTRADVLPDTLNYAVPAPTFYFEGQAPVQGKRALLGVSGANDVNYEDAAQTSGGALRMVWNQPKLFADLSTATAATINQIRESFQIQKLLERDARGGTRYTEIVRSHFGVISPDARLQRPEYLGGGSSPIGIHPVAQTSGTPSDSQAGYTPTPQANLSAFGTALARGHGFRYSATEHGYLIGLVNVRADLSYQQGLRKLWSRSTRFDFYWPVFAALGEQAVLMSEIFHTGNPANDDVVFGYQERWAEYRYHPSVITSRFRSQATGTLDSWHLAQFFGSAPTLSGQFIADTPPVERVVAAGAEAVNQQFLMDAFIQIRMARPMPMYSVPGLVDHF